MPPLIFSLLLSLVLTECFEILFALLCRVRDGRSLGLVLLVNLLTNPPVVLLALTFPSPWVTAGLELSAVLVEGLLYRRGLPGLRHPLWFSLGANTVSYLLGLLLNLL